MLRVATWANANAPRDAVFLVPPGEGSAFNLSARRSQIVCYKQVPQLSGELAVWNDRLQTVVGADDLLEFADDLDAYRDAQDAMDRAYHQRPHTELLKVARELGATHVIVRQNQHGDADAPIVYDDWSTVIYQVD